LIAFFGTSCSSSTEQTVLEKPKNLKVEILEFHENGKPKSQKLYSNENGIKVIYGYEEFYPSGKTKITGLYNKSHKRDGLWKSFYETGTPWSTGGYLSGIENGEKKVWYPDGQLRYEGEMKDGKPIGTWSFQDEKGVKTTKNYK
jgi:antitoxin component YwqK of YwqJK toxin-antitoxin module